MNIFKRTWKWLISADENNPYNGHPEKKGYATRHDIERWGEMGKARPIWGCLPVLLVMFFIGYFIYTLYKIFSGPVPF